MRVNSCAFSSCMRSHVENNSSILVVGSIKLAKKGALKVHEVPLTKCDEAIRQAFEERAREMLGKCERTLDDDHMDKLIEIIEEGDRIREEENKSDTEFDSDTSSGKRRRDDNEEEVAKTKPKKDNY